MAVEDFAACYVERVGGSVDAVFHWSSQMGADGIRAVRDTWNSLNIAEQGVIGWIAAKSAEALSKILTRVLGIELAQLLLIALGGFSWGLLISGIVACADTA